MSESVEMLPLKDLTRQIAELMEYRDSEELTADERAAVDTEIVRYVRAEVAKVDNVRAYWRHCEMMAQFAREEERRNQKRALMWEARLDRLKGIVKEAMQGAGITSVEGKTGKFRVQKNGGKRPIEIVDESMIPSRYSPPVITTPLNTEMVREDLESGIEVPGARLGERGSRVRVE